MPGGEFADAQGIGVAPREGLFEDHVDPQRSQEFHHLEVAVVLDEGPHDLWPCLLDEGAIVRRIAGVGLDLLGSFDQAGDGLGDAHEVCPVDVRDFGQLAPRVAVPQADETDLGRGRDGFAEHESHAGDDGDGAQANRGNAMA